MRVFGTDYDGVIINIEPQKARAFGVLLNKHWGVNKDEAAQFWIETGGKPRRYKFEYFYNKQFKEKLNDEKYQKIEKEYSHLLKDKFYPSLKLLPHALQILQYARSHYDFLFVSSGVPMQEIQYLVKINGVSEYFNLILGTDKTYSSKREHFQKIITDQNPDLIVYIADGLEDMRIAKEFKAISIGTPTNHSKKELLDAGAVHVCNLSGVIPLLKRLS